MDHAKKLRSRIVLGTLFTTLFWTIAPPSQAAPLTIVNVGAPAINCKFDSDCTITVNDSAGHFTLTSTSGDAFLQSRTFKAAARPAPQVTTKARLARGSTICCRAGRWTAPFRGFFVADPQRFLSSS